MFNSTLIHQIFCLFLFYISVNCLFLSFEQLVGQNSQSEDVTVGSGKQLLPVFYHF